MNDDTVDHYINTPSLLLQILSLPTGAEGSVSYRLSSSYGCQEDNRSETKSQVILNACTQ